MAPQTLVTALILGPDGSAKLDPGALHGRSELESGLSFVPRRELVGEGQSWWMVWVAIEVDNAKQPVRYKGLSTCEVFVNRGKAVGYKSLSEHVNKMSEAIRGGVNLSKLSPEARVLVKQQLMTLGAELWERTSESLKKDMLS